MRWIKLVALAFGTLVVGCSMREMTEGREKAEKAVADFHAAMNEGRFADIYDGSSDELRKSSGREKFVELLTAIQRKLGRATGTDNKGWRVKSWNLTTYVETAQSTRFEHGAGHESFRFVIRDGKAALVAYNINSNDLITR